MKRKLMTARQKNTLDEQAKMLNEMWTMVYDNDVTPEEKLKEFVGHTPSQVVAGFALGILIAVLMHI